MADRLGRRAGLATCPPLPCVPTLQLPGECGDGRRVAGGFMKDACPVKPEGALAPCSMPFPGFVQLSHAGCDSDAQPGGWGGSRISSTIDRPASRTGSTAVKGDSLPCLP